MKRNVFKIYVKPFDDAGQYLPDWIDVTEDVNVNALGNISQQLDNSEFDIGIFRNSTINLTLSNLSGRYSDVDVLQSIFRFKRADSLVRITWQYEDGGAVCGWAELGDAYLGEEIEVFRGLLADLDAVMNVLDRELRFTVLGLESFFDRVSVPFSSISNGDLISDVVLTCLQSGGIDELMTVDPDNFDFAVDLAIDTVASLEGKTVQEAIRSLLLISNSVLWVQDGVIFISPRTTLTPSTLQLFGQGSNTGVENIMDIQEIRTGVNRIFNYLTWKDTGILELDASSVTSFGVRKKEIDSELITNQTNREIILQSILTEFFRVKQEFKIKTPFNYESADAFLLNTVSIDYPIAYVAGESPLPICGIAICGQAVLPLGIWSFQIDPDDEYKIISRSINPKDGTVTYGMRRV